MNETLSRWEMLLLSLLLAIAACSCIMTAWCEDVALQENQSYSRQLNLRVYVDEGGRSLVTGFITSVEDLAFLNSSSHQYDNSTGQLYAVTSGLTAKDGDQWSMRFSANGAFSEYHSTIYLPAGVKAGGIDCSAGLKYLVSSSNDSFILDVQGYDVIDPKVSVMYQLPLVRAASAAGLASTDKQASSKQVPEGALGAILLVLASAVGIAFWRLRFFAKGSSSASEEHLMASVQKKEALTAGDETMDSVLEARMPDRNAGSAGADVAVTYVEEEDETETGESPASSRYQAGLHANEIKSEGLKEGPNARQRKETDGVPGSSSETKEGAGLIEAKAPQRQAEAPSEVEQDSRVAAFAEGAATDSGIKQHGEIKHEHEGAPVPNSAGKAAFAAIDGSSPAQQPQTASDEPTVRAIPSGSRAQSQLPLEITSEMAAVLETLTSRERSVINSLIDRGGRTTQAEIRYETGIPKSSLTGILLSLERRKLVIKKEWGRTNVIELSEWFLSKTERSSGGSTVKDNRSSG